MVINVDSLTRVFVFSVINWELDRPSLRPISWISFLSQLSLDISFASHKV